MRRLKWRYVGLCLICWTVVYVGKGQRVRVEFEGGYYLSRLVCSDCAHVLGIRKVLQASAFGRTLEITKRDQVGPHRIRGDGTWSCKGVWL